MKTVSITFALMLSAAACGGSASAPAKPQPPTLPISMETARQTALAKVPGEIDEEELEEEDGRWVYELEIKPTAGGAKQEITIDANTGAIVEVGDDD